jgi:hypothetical protein
MVNASRHDAELAMPATLSFTLVISDEMPQHQSDKMP